MLSQQIHRPPFTILERLFGLSEFTSWPNAKGLNLLRNRLQIKGIGLFVDQSDLNNEPDYYEQIIYRKGMIPTRENNWHDLFNGLIWLLFPKTKTLLNELHIEDIETFGLSPRTKRRNHLTHFDECGVVLAYEDKTLLTPLASHQWLDCFVEQRHKWSKEITAFVFGHANLEMLLEPFLGLTGKWLAVKVEPSFWALPEREQFKLLDQRLVTQLTEQQIFNQKKPLLPLPLLGIPGWWDANLNPEFYLNQGYFRPKTVKA